MRNYIHIIVCAILLTGCSKGLDEVPVVKPDYTNESVSLSFNTETASKATYSAGLEFYWENEDPMAVIKATAGSEQQLIKYEENKKIFSGDVEYVAGEGAFHFLYPSSTESTLTADNTGNISATVTIPEDQDGKWTPILYGTVNAVSLGAITDKIQLNNLTASFGVKVYNSKSDPSEENTKKIKRITIEATNSNDDPLPITGTYSIIDNKLVAVDSKNSATISREDATYPTDKDGDPYEYRFEVAPVGEANITITMIDEAGNTYITKTTKELSANYRSGVNVLWANGINVDFHTSYDEYGKGQIAEANNEDLRNKIRLTPKTVAGATVTLINADTEEEINVDNELAIGSYNCYVKIEFEGGKEYRTTTKTLHITGLPYSATPPTRANGWTVYRGSNKISWKDDYLSIGDGGTVTSDPTVQSPSFHVPDNIAVDTNITGKVYTRYVWPVNYHCTLTVNVGNETRSQTSNSTSGNNINFGTIQALFSQNNNTITIAINGRTEFSGYARITGVEVKYGQRND